MKKLLFLFIVVLFCSCSNDETQKILQQEIESLRSQVSELTKDNKLLSCSVDSLKHSNDSLLRIADRWRYGKQSMLYENDYIGGNSVSWRYARSQTELTFDESLLNKESIQFSKSRNYSCSDLSVEDLLNNIVNNEEQRVYVNTAFESDRANYKFTVLLVNALNDAVYYTAAKLMNREDVPRVRMGYVTSVYAGLIYKEFYENSTNEEAYEFMKNFYREIFYNAYLR